MKWNLHKSTLETLETEKSQSVLKPFLKKSLKERVLKEQSSKTANMSTPSSAERLLLWMREMSYLERL